MPRKPDRRGKTEPEPVPDAAADDAVVEEIRRRAYLKFLARGPGNGHDVEDWLRAEDEVRAGRPRRR